MRDPPYDDKSEREMIEGCCLIEIGEVASLKFWKWWTQEDLSAAEGLLLLVKIWDIILKKQWKLFIEDNQFCHKKEKQMNHMLDEERSVKGLG